MTTSFFVHPQALCESQHVGNNTKVWAFAHVMKGAQIGANCNVGDHVFIEGGTTVGDGVTIKNNVLIWEGVEIADGVFVGPAVVFTNDRFPRSPRCGVPEVEQRYKQKDSWLVKTRVQEGASLGAGSVICPGVSIGRFATVAAGAVVTKDIKHHALVMGNPARQVGWVCRCGIRLQEKTQTLVCENCSTKYAKSEDGLQENLTHAPKS